MTRSQRDSMGEVELPAEALYGPQTARAMANFPISGWTMPRRFLAALGRIKQAAAVVHKDGERLDAAVADAICRAAEELAEGRLDAHFPVDVFQTGSGTSTNMNANEVIAARAEQLLREAGSETRVHPNDDVNRGQSSNDVIPSALQVAAAVALHDELIPALRMLREALEDKAEEFDRILKVARTHLMDAVPIRLGQEFGGYAAQIDATLSRLQAAMSELCELPIGGTAVGTGLNAPEQFAADVCLFLGEELRLPFTETTNHFAAQASADVAVAASSALRGCALAIGKIASDIRLMASGPRCGLGELRVAPLQPGSSIMPGKINPVLCESAVQVACQVVGCDAAVASAATGGVGSVLDIHLAWPCVAWNLLTQISLLTGLAKAFTEKVIIPLEADERRCRELLERSLSLVTVLAPRIGYDEAAEIVKKAAATGQSIREICRLRNILPEDELDALLDPDRQTGR